MVIPCYTPKGPNGAPMVLKKPYWTFGEGLLGCLADLVSPQPPTEPHIPITHPLTSFYGWPSLAWALYKEAVRTRLPQGPSDAKKAANRPLAGYLLLMIEILHAPIYVPYITRIL